MSLPRFTLVVHPQSYITVRGFVDYLQSVITEITGERACLKLAKHLDDANADVESIVLAIGYRLSGLEHGHKGLLVFVNFSVLYPIRGFWTASRAAHSLMRNKRQQFLRALDGIDVVLDFFSAHTHELKSRFPKLPVISFPTNIMTAYPYLDFRSCEYDVCIVGSETKRRRKVHRELLDKGLSLSPVHSEDFAMTIAKSRVVLNVHTHRYDNFEVPRFITSFAMGRIVVTEKTIGLKELVPQNLFEESSLRLLPNVLVRTLSNKVEVQRRGKLAFDYMQNDYTRYCRKRWGEILENLFVMQSRLPELRLRRNVQP